MSIFSKLFKLFLTVVLMPLIPMALLLAYYQNRQKDMILEAHYNLAEVIAFDIDHYAEDLAWRLSFTSELAGIADKTQIEQQLAVALASNTDFLFLSWLEKNGNEAAHVLRTGFKLGQMVPLMPQVPAVQSSRKIPLYMNVIKDASGAAAVQWAYPQVDGALLYGISSLDNLLDRFAQMRIGRTGQVFLFTAQGQPLPGLYQNVLGIFPEKLQKHFAGPSRLIRGLDSSEGILVGAYAQALPLDIYVAVLQPKEEAFRSLYFSNLVLCMFLAAIAMLAYFGALAFSRSLGEPIAHLSEAAQAVSGGNLDYHIDEEEGWGEFKQLMVAFNKMTADLKDYQALQLKNQISEMKEQVFRSVAHDLRAPLLGLQGYIYLLSSGQITSQERQEYISRMNEAAKELSSLLEDILAVSRVEAGLTLPQREQVEWAPLLQSICRTLEPAAQEKKLELSCLVTPGSFVWADPKLLRRIVSNLLSNAIKYTQAGFVRLNVREEETQTILEVSDSGPGLTKQQCVEIFEKNRQMNVASDGYGLGLFISRQLARAHKGELDVISAPGKGSTFILRLPREGA